MTNRIAVVYFGTPAYAEPALRALAGDERFEVRLVVTQPDRPAGRGRTLRAPRVKDVAEELGLPTYQPLSLREAAAREPLTSAEADVFVVAAYGLIFGTKTLGLPRLGCVNLHASILPAYRGAAPIPAAILNGDPETGVTLMRMEAGLDTGAIIDVARTPILPSHTTGSLTAVLADLGAVLVRDALPRWAHGDLPEVPQPGGASVVRQLTKRDGAIDWTRPAIEIERHARAMEPWPRAWTGIGDTVIQILAATPAPDGPAEPGRFRILNGVITVGTGTGAIALDLVQLPGGRPVPSRAAVQGGQVPAEGTFDGAPPREPLIRVV